MTKRIDYNFVIGTTFLIVNSVAGVADWLQGGIAWPLLWISCAMPVMILATRRR